MKESIVEGAGAQLARCKRERAARRRGAVDRVDHENAVAGGFRTRPSGIGDAQQRISGRATTIDDELIGWRIVGAKKSTQRQRAAGAHIAVDGQGPKNRCRKSKTGRHRAGIGDRVEDRSGAAQGPARLYGNRRYQRAGQVDGAVGDDGRTGIGVGARQAERAGAHFDKRAAGAADDAAYLGRKIVAADRKLFRAKNETTRTLDRARRHPASRQGGYVEYASGVGDEACISAGGAVLESSDTTGVGDDGGVAGGARIEKKQVRLATDDKSRWIGRIVDDAGAGDPDFCEEGWKCRETIGRRPRVELQRSDRVGFTVKGRNKIEVVFDAPKVAVLVGTAAGTQLEAAFQKLLPGEADHIALWACAPVPHTHSANESIVAFER